MEGDEQEFPGHVFLLPSHRCHASRVKHPSRSMSSSNPVTTKARTTTISSGCAQDLAINEDGCKNSPSVELDPFQHMLVCKTNRLPSRLYLHTSSQFFTVHINQSTSTRDSISECKGVDGMLSVQRRHLPQSTTKWDLILLLRLLRTSFQPCCESLQYSLAYAWRCH